MKQVPSLCREKWYLQVPFQPEKKVFGNFRTITILWPHRQKNRDFKKIVGKIASPREPL
jgi:hypothetical protein